MRVWQRVLQLAKLPSNKEDKSEGKKRRRRAVLVAFFIPYVPRSPRVSTLTHHDSLRKGDAMSVSIPCAHPFDPYVRFLAGRLVLSPPFAGHVMSRGPIAPLKYGWQRYWHWRWFRGTEPLLGSTHHTVVFFSLSIVVEERAEPGKSVER